MRLITILFSLIIVSCSNLSIQREVAQVEYTESLINIHKIRGFRKDKGIANGGYDVVHYFNLFEQRKGDLNALRGKKEFQSNYEGVTFYFANQENLDRFETDKSKYIPQFGGYCAFAMANGYIAPVDPDAWTIVDDKLYLNYSKRVRKNWRKDIPGYIKKAKENWPKILIKKD